MRFTSSGRMNDVCDRTIELRDALRTHAGFLCVALGIALLTRIYGLEKESLWLDEVASFQFASKSLTHALAAENTNPPFYYVLLHFWIQLFGTSEAGLRSLSVLPSIAAVILTYFLGARVYTERVGMLAASFMALSTFHIAYAQEARAFALLSALLLGSMLTMDVALRTKYEHRCHWPWVLYLLTTTAALYTHFYAVFFVVAENLLFVIRWRKNRHNLTRWMVVQLALLVAFTPWLITMLQTVSGGGQVRRYLLLKFPQAIFSFLAGDTFVPLDEAAVRDISGTLLAHWYYLVVFAAGFGFLFISALSKVNENRRGALFCAVMVLGPMVMAFVVSFKVMIFEERYLIGASPMLYLFLASGVPSSFITGLFSQNRKCPFINVFACMLVVGIGSVSLYNYYFHPRFGKEQWHQVVTYIEQNATSDDLVVFDAAFVDICYDYYATRPITKLRLHDGVVGDNNPEWLVLAAKISTRDRVWLVRSHHKDDTMLHELQKRFTQNRVKFFKKDNGIEVYTLSN